MKSSLKPSRKHIKWNEEVIQEHDKDRGTREKITEAKTPYNYADLSDSDTEESKELDIHNLHSKLEESKRKQDFNEHRKAHYNEFLMVKRQREVFSDDSSDEQEEERYREVSNSNMRINPSEGPQDMEGVEEYHQEAKD